MSGELQTANRPEPDRFDGALAGKTGKRRIWR